MADPVFASGRRSIESTHKNASDAVPCLELRIDGQFTDEVCGHLEELGATAIECRDASTLTAEHGTAVVFSVGFANHPARDRAHQAIRRHSAVQAATAVDVGGDGWSTGWHAFHSAVTLRTIEIVTSWMTSDTATKATVVIDPGQAFGTGGHSTTRLLLEMLEKRALDGRLPQEIADIGTGSGVLAIAAVTLGVRRALAIDSDPDAIATATKNARRNSASHAVELRCATPAEIDGSFPLVLANIDLGTFETHAANIAELVTPDGEVLISGLLIDQVASGLDLWPDFLPIEQRTREDWVALALQRRQ